MICDLNEHTEEISACQFNFSGTQVVTSSIDQTCKLWDLRNPSKSVHTFKGHSNEIMDVTFNLTGTKIASASTDNTVQLCDVKTLKTDYVLKGKL
jgi:dynein assembly factor with WDR repeat domains 1